MNNEEKILRMLEKLTEDVSGLKEDVSKLKEDSAEMRETLTMVAITQENVVLPQLRLLAEGHAHLTKTLASKEQVDKLESDLSFTKVVINSLSERLANLEEAQ